ncbi:MAG: hypothetical protein AAGI88_08670 [Pseudomonadota bacterium]
MRKQRRAPGRLELLGMLFISAVILVVAQTQQLVIPLFLGLLTWFKVSGKGFGKALLQTLTPKLGVLLLKNSVFIQLRKLTIQASTHLFVKSHKPWRRFFTRLRIALMSTVTRLFSGYLSLPLAVRTLIAIVVLLATAGSSFAVFALLIIPQPLLNWLQARLRVILGRLGVTQFFSALWRTLVPLSLLNAGTCT